MLRDYVILNYMWYFPQFAIRGYQRSYTLGWFWVGLVNCAVMHSF